MVNIEGVLTIPHSDNVRVIFASEDVAINNRNKSKCRNEVSGK